MCGAISHLPYTYSWHGAQLSRGFIFMMYLVKHGDRFTSSFSSFTVFILHVLILTGYTVTLF